jgi:hypothetical protein
VIGGAAGVDDLEAVVVLLVQRDVAVAEDDDVVVGEPATHAGQAAVAGARVVDDADPDTGDGHAELVGEPALEVPVVVAQDDVDGRADGLQLVERVGVAEVAGVDDRRGALEVVDDRGGEPASALGEVGVAQEGDPRVG